MACAFSKHINIPIKHLREQNRGTSLRRFRKSQPLVLGLPDQSAEQPMLMDRRCFGSNGACSC